MEEDKKMQDLTKGMEWGFPRIVNRQEDKNFKAKPAIDDLSWLTEAKKIRSNLFFSPLEISLVNKKPKNKNKKNNNHWKNNKFGGK